MNRTLIVVALFAFSLFTSNLVAQELPEIPVGLDAYRQWDKWPLQRVGVRAYMRSTYDRTGGNEGADASHFLYQEGEDFSVTLDIAGKGCLYFARYNHWHGSPWHYEVDGRDHIIRETSTSDPDHPTRDSVFEPQTALPNPLTWTWSTTKGADLMWVPIAFDERFRMAYSRTHYGTGYYIFHQHVPGLSVSQELQPWSPRQMPDPNVLKLLRQSGDDLLKEGDELSRLPSQLFSAKGTTNLSPSNPLDLTIEEGAIVLRAIEFSVPRDQAETFGKAHLQLYWDDRSMPSVDAPLPLFFGTGTFYNRDDREFIVKAFPVNVRYTEERLHVACYFPMPLFHKARLKVELPEGSIDSLKYRVAYHKSDFAPHEVGYFHASYQDHGAPQLGHDLVFLDTRNEEGSKEWSGSFIGTSFIFSDRNNLSTLEGDPRFYFDDAQSPQAYGTGTEEWGGGGDYWGGRNMTLPFAGHPVGAPSLSEAQSTEDQIHSAYRFLLADLMPFGKNARICFEHGGINQSQEHYQSVAYWYGIPAPSLIHTDHLNIGDEQSERAHQYISPDASAPTKIVSRFEWGPDSFVKQFNHPQPDAEDFVDFEFEAEADVAYHIYVLGRSLADNINQDAVWLQFNDLIGTAELHPGFSEQLGFGNWKDRYAQNEWGWSSTTPNLPPTTIKFRKSGTQRLRIQSRQMPHEIKAIWLSKSQTQMPKSTDLPDADGTDEIILVPKLTTKIAGDISSHEDDGGTRVLRIDGDGKELAVPRSFASPSEPPTEIVEGRGAMIVQKPQEQTGRTTRGHSEFELAIRPDNHGVLLRRLLDYQYPNQRANVYVAKKDGEKEERDWQLAGVWYLAGGSRYLYSNPRPELGATNHKVYESNRRYREDEFLVPLELTRGKNKLILRIEFDPIDKPLQPGQPLTDQAWSEISYDAYSFVTPEFKLPTERNDD